LAAEVMYGLRQEGVADVLKDAVAPRCRSRSAGDAAASARSAGAGTRPALPRKQADAPSGSHPGTAPSVSAKSVSAQETSIHRRGPCTRRTGRTLPRARRRAPAHRQSSRRLAARAAAPPGTPLSAASAALARASTGRSARRNGLAPAGNRPFSALRCRSSPDRCAAGASRRRSAATPPNNAVLPRTVPETRRCRARR
jgi:hypothetical protein